MQPLQFADDSLEEAPGLVGPLLSSYIEILLRRRWLIASCVLTSLLLTGVVTWYSKPMYRATTLLNLDRDRANPFEVGGAPGRDPGADSETLATETQLMRNREVAERVVTKLRLEGTPDAQASNPDGVMSAALRVQ